MNTKENTNRDRVESTDLLSLSRDVEEKAKKLLVHAMEFRDDWRKGDFDLSNLAKCDMESMEEQFEPLWDALKAITTHRLKTPQNLFNNADVMASRPRSSAETSTQEDSERDSVDVHRLVSTYRTDYPKKRIGGGNPYYKCSICGASEPEINGQLDGHRDSCSWANHQRSNNL